MMVTLSVAVIFLLYMRQDKKTANKEIKNEKHGIYRCGNSDRHTFL